MLKGFLFAGIECLSELSACREGGYSVYGMVVFYDTFLGGW